MANLNTEQVRMGKKLLEQGQSASYIANYLGVPETGVLAALGEAPAAATGLRGIIRGRGKGKG